MDLKIITVAAGCVVLLAIIVKYLQKDKQDHIALSCFLAFLGFALLASPAWTNITLQVGNSRVKVN